MNWFLHGLPISFLSFFFQAWQQVHKTILSLLLPPTLASFPSSFHHCLTLLSRSLPTRCLPSLMCNSTLFPGYNKCCFMSLSPAAADTTGTCTLSERRSLVGRTRRWIEPDLHGMYMWCGSLPLHHAGDAVSLNRDCTHFLSSLLIHLTAGKQHLYSRQCCPCFSRDSTFRKLNIRWN